MEEAGKVSGEVEKPTVASRVTDVNAGASDALDRSKESEAGQASDFEVVGKVSGEEEKANMESTVTDENAGASKALDRLRESEASQWLAAPPDLVDCAKRASEILFSLTATNFEKVPLSRLYTDRFDAEQIWQQIDLQSHPILPYIRRKLRSLEKSSNGVFFTCLEANEIKITGYDKPQPEEVVGRQSGSDSKNEREDESHDADMGDVESGSSSADEEEDMVEKDGERNGVEDDFFKISEMEKFLDRTDAEGVFGAGREDIHPSTSDDEEADEASDLEAGVSDDDEEEAEGLGFGKYEEFFGKDKKKRKPKAVQEGSEDELQEDDVGNSVQVKNLSTHERRQENIQKQMRQLEKASLDPKDWTQQGEVTAKRRPINSALEVELDFEHNARPPPVITEEITSSLEDIIRGRIAEGRFDDPHRKMAAPVTAPRERVELDESKSQKGLGEIYEADYMQKTGLAAAPTSTAEALKAEASELFKALCSRLDALSHFHFAPKPVIDDMGVRADVPALAMEEVAPLAVSEASMLAPEEIFAGDNVIKGEGELTPEERKRRRAQKKRKRKGEKNTLEAERIRKRIHPMSSAPTQTKATPGLKLAHSSYAKSSKVFAELDKGKDAKGKAIPKKDDRPNNQRLHSSFLKL